LSLHIYFLNLYTALIQDVMKIKSQETEISRKILRLTSQKKFCEVTPKNLKIFSRIFFSRLIKYMRKKILRYVNL